MSSQSIAFLGPLPGAKLQNFTEKFEKSSIFKICSPELRNRNKIVIATENIFLRELKKEH